MGDTVVILSPEIDTLFLFHLIIMATLRDKNFLSCSQIRESGAGEVKELTACPTLSRGSVETAAVGL